MTITIRGITLFALISIMLSGCNHNDLIQQEPPTVAISRVWQPSDVSFTLVKQTRSADAQVLKKQVVSLVVGELTPAQLSLLQHLTLSHEKKCQLDHSQYVLSVQRPSGALDKFVSDNSACDSLSEVTARYQAFVTQEALATLFSLSERSESNPS